MRYENLYLLFQEMIVNPDWIATSEARCNPIRNQIPFFATDFKSGCNPLKRNAIWILQSCNRNTDYACLRVKFGQNWSKCILGCIKCPDVFKTFLLLFYFVPLIAWWCSAKCNGHRMLFRGSASASNIHHPYNMVEISKLSYRAHRMLFRKLLTRKTTFW